MTPQLIDALARLSPLNTNELAVVGATASALMARSGPVPTAPIALPNFAPLPTVPIRRRGLPRQPGGAAVFDVPVIGGTALSLQPSPGFAQPTFAERWRPGRRIQVYLAGNRSVAALMRRLQYPNPEPGQRGLCAFKVGHHEVGTDLSVRLRRISADRYGSLWRDGSTIVADPHWGTWTIEPLNPGCAEPAIGSPVRLGVDAIEVTLPATMTPAGFDQRLGQLLSSSTLASFALSPAGRELCAALGENHARFVRYSPRDAGKSRRATEITLIGRHDIGRLLRVIEQLLLDYVLFETIG